MEGAGVLVFAVIYLIATAISVGFQWAVDWHAARRIDKMLAAHRYDLEQGGPYR